MDQDATCYRGRPWPRRHCVTWSGPTHPSLKKGTTPTFWRMSIVAKRLLCIRIPLGMEVGLSIGDIVLHGDPAPPGKKAQPLTQFLANVQCGQAAGWIKTPLGMEVDVGPGQCLLWPQSSISAKAGFLLKCRNSMGNNGHGGRNASPCLISQRSVQLLLWYGDFLISQDGSRRRVGFLNFKIFNGLNGHDYRTASLWQILTKSLMLGPGSVDFFIFAHGGRRQLGFLKLQSVTGRTHQDGRTASMCEMSSKSVNVQPRPVDFLRWRPPPYGIFYFWSL